MPDKKPVQKNQPGKESKMSPKPITDNPEYIGSGKLANKVAIITGGDSGIGRAVAIAFTKEGCRCSIVYLNEHKDAQETKEIIEKLGGSCLLISGDIRNEAFCKNVVQETVSIYGRIDVLVNNAAEQHPEESIEDITKNNLTSTFETNIFAMFYLVQSALPRMKKGSVIINTTSVTAYRGSDHLIDYSSTKGAIVSFTRSLSQSLAKKGIRVNAVAPGPIWTPLIPSTFPKKEVETFGQDVPLGRAGQPYEIAPSYVFLASTDSSYMTGQVLHPNGGEIING